MTDYTNIFDYNLTGVDNLLTYVAVQVPAFIPLLLFAIFFIITLSIYFGTKRLNGQGDFFASMAVGSLVTTVIAGLMTLKDGLINTYVLAFCVVLTIVSVVILIFSKER